MQPTNPQKFTEKAWEAIAKSPDIAKQSNQQQIEQEGIIFHYLLVFFISLFFSTNILVIFFHQSVTHI